MKTPPAPRKLASRIVLAASLALATTGCLTPRPSGEIVEWAEFKLAAGVSEDTLLRAADAVHENFLRKQPGFVRLELLRGKDGQWVDLVYWKDQASVDQALAGVKKSAACSNYFRCMANPDEAVPFYRRVKSHPR
jgi:heme-degrading monooxygenase HmoA